MFRIPCIDAAKVDVFPSGCRDVFQAEFLLLQRRTRVSRESTVTSDCHDPHITWPTNIGEALLRQKSCRSHRRQ